MRGRSLAQEHDAVPRPGLEPGSLCLFMSDTNSLTIKISKRRFKNKMKVFKSYICSKALKTRKKEKLKTD